jgi:hypothetical protein
VASTGLQHPSSCRPTQHEISRRVFLSSEDPRCPSGAPDGYAICMTEQQQAWLCSCPTSVRLINAFTYLTTLPAVQTAAYSIECCGDQWIKDGKGCGRKRSDLNWICQYLCEGSDNGHNLQLEQLVSGLRLHPEAPWTRSRSGFKPTLRSALSIHINFLPFLVLQIIHALYDIDHNRRRTCHLGQGYMCACAWVVLCPPDPLSKLSYRMYN